MGNLQSAVKLFVLRVLEETDASTGRHYLFIINKNYE